MMAVILAFLSKAWGGIKTLFEPKNFKYLIAIVFLILFGVIGWQSWRNGKLKKEIAVLTVTNDAYKSNIAVLNETAVKWKTKDSISVVTVGLLQADKQMFKDSYSDLDKKFNNLIKDNGKKVVRNQYLETQIGIRDSMIAYLVKGKPDTTGSFISSDSTIHIADIQHYDTRNYKSITGNIKLRIDNNKIEEAAINIMSEFGLGVDLATYTDKNGVPRVSVGTKYPGAVLSVSGISDIESKLAAIKSKSAEKGAFGIGLSAGYGGFIIPGQVVQKGIYLGVGLNWTPKFLRFGKVK